MTDLDRLLAHLREVTDPDKVDVSAGRIEWRTAFGRDFSEWMSRARYLINQAEAEAAAARQERASSTEVAADGLHRVTIEADGRSEVYLGRLVSFDKSVEMFDVATVDGLGVEFIRDGSGEVSVRLRYVNGPRDTPTG